MKLIRIVLVNGIAKNVEITNDAYEQVKKQIGQNARLDSGSVTINLQYVTMIEVLRG